MQIIPLKVSKILKPGDNLIDLIVELISSKVDKPSSGDILAMSIKIVSISKGYIIEKTSIKPSEKALRISRKYNVSPETVELILKKKIVILGGTNGVLATFNRGILIGNGGLDRKNVGVEYIVYWPDDPDSEAYNIRKELYTRLGVSLGVILVDSHVNPLRKGTTAVVVGLSGLNPLRDYRGTKDLYGRKIRFTIQNIADELASAAHIYMGEGVEKTPFVYIKNPPTAPCENCTSELMKLDPKECVYMKNNFDRMKLPIY